MKNNPAGYRIRRLIITACIIILSSAGISESQVKSGAGFWKWATWGLLQAVPSVTCFEDRNGTDSRFKLGLQWHIIPVSYSFNSNKYVSDLSFFFIRPVKRYSGSVELFLDPQVIPGGFKYSYLDKFMFKSGGRVVFPLWQKGEYLSFSLGGGMSYRKDTSGAVKCGATYETGIYSFFGMLGIKFNYYTNSESRFSFGMYFKYY